MLAGAFCGALASYYSGSPWIGLLGAVAGGVAIALLYAVTAIRFRADQVVVGIAINLLVIGVTRFFLRLAFHSSANSPRVPGFGAEQSGTGRRVAGRQSADLAGHLRGRARGLAALPHAVRACACARWASIRPPRRRSGIRVESHSVSVGGAVRRAGGAGRRVSRARPASVQRGDDGGPRLHRPRRGDLRPLGSGSAPRWRACCSRRRRRCRSSCRARKLIPSQFVEMIPYALTIVALAGVVGRATPPAALGKVPE